MKSYFPMLVGAALLAFALLAYKSETFVGDFKTGVWIGAGLVVFLLYPVYLRNHERRLEALERSLDLPRDMPAIERKP